MRYIFSFASGDFFKRISEITFPTFEAYAKKVGAEFVCDLPPLYSDIQCDHFRKFVIRDFLKNDDDSALWVDADAIITSQCFDLFSLSAGNFYAFPESDYIDREKNFNHFVLGFEKEIPENFLKRRYYNSGVFVLHKKDAEKFEPPTPAQLLNIIQNKKNEPNKFFWDQDWFNYIRRKNNIVTNNMPLKYNTMSNLVFTAWDMRIMQSSIIHYAGMRYDKEKLRQMIVEDIKDLEKMGR